MAPEVVAPEVVASECGDRCGRTTHGVRVARLGVPNRFWTCSCNLAVVSRSQRGRARSRRAVRSGTLCTPLDVVHS